jgi:L-lactate dehydrogenase complex protein LldF
MATVTPPAARRGSRGNLAPTRAAAREALPEFAALRDRARDMQAESRATLDLSLEAYEAQVVASGGVVHWAETAEDARRIVLEICRAAGAKTVNKGKTMISEECGINDWLLANGIRPVETDLGEYIIQLRGEIPSHIIAPAVHVTVPEVETAFRKAHTHLPADRDLSDMAALQAEARGVLREKYFARSSPRASLSSASSAPRSRSGGRSVCALRNAASTWGTVTCTAGAMMWLGVSPRSWMMYSPRSVSTGLMPFSAR